LRFAGVSYFVRASAISCRPFGLLANAIAPARSVFFLGMVADLPSDAQ
jgi:hypothetical protein